MIKTKFNPHDMMISITPHLTKQGRWTGEVSIKVIVDDKNPLHPDDYQDLLHFTRQVCASVPLMEENELFRDATEKIAEKFLPMNEILMHPEDGLTREDKNGNVVRIDFKNKTRH